MLRATHKLMAEKIAAELRLSEKNKQILVSGSLGPDSQADFPHQTGKNRKILYKIGKARVSFLENDDECYGEIGNALHYIQDKWVSNLSGDNETTAIFEDNLLLPNITQAEMQKEARTDYLKTASMLLTIKNSGIEVWFNHSWGIWQKDYASCVYVFADILELMLPTLQPDTSIIADKERLKNYLESEAFRWSVQAAFFASMKTNFLYPKLDGYAAAVYSLASIEPPCGHRDPVLDLNIVYRLSLEIARYVLSPHSQFKYVDSWTTRTEKSQNVHLDFIMPQYHVLIPKPVEEVKKQRIAHFDEYAEDFLANWDSVKVSPQASLCRSLTWKTLLNQLVEMLKQN
jgi:hypothetical protein